MPLGLSATAKKLLRSTPSTRATMRIWPSSSIAPGLKTALMPSRSIRCGFVAMVQVVSPEDRRMLGRQHRVLVPLEHAVAVETHPIGAIDEGFIFREQLSQPCIELIVCHP